MTFGRYLIDKGVCSQEQVDQAGRSRVVFGGRIGTNLVEMGHLHVKDLEPLLADYRARPAAPEAWLTNRDPAVRAALPLALIEKYQVLPLALQGMRLHVAMVNPRDPAVIEELQFTSSCDVVPYVLSEIRMRVLLAYHYDLPCDPRFLNLAPAIPKPEAEIPAPPPASELIDEATFAAMQADWQASDRIGFTDLKSEPFAQIEPESGPVRDRTALEMERGLTSANNRDAIADAALALAAVHAQAAALFVVRGGVVTGFRGEGAGLPHYIEGVMLPVEIDSAFASVARNGTSYRGPLGTKLDQRVLAALGRSEVAQALIIPVRIQRRVVNLLYADAGGEPLAETCAAALEAVATLTARAYQQLILRVKSMQASGAV